MRARLKQGEVVVWDVPASHNLTIALGLKGLIPIQCALEEVFNDIEPGEELILYCKSYCLSIRKDA